MVWCASRVKQYRSGRSWVLFAQTARIIWKNAYLASAPSSEVLNQRTMKWNSSKSLGRKGVGRLHETFAENDTGDVACLLRWGASHTLCVGIDFWLPHIRPFSFSVVIASFDYLLRFGAAHKCRSISSNIKLLSRAYISQQAIRRCSQNSTFAHGARRSGRQTGSDVKM